MTTRAKQLNAAFKKRNIKIPRAGSSAKASPNGIALSIIPRPTEFQRTHVRGIRNDDIETLIFNEHISELDLPIDDSFAAKVMQFLSDVSLFVLDCGAKINLRLSAGHQESIF